MSATASDQFSAYSLLKLLVDDTEIKEKLNECKDTVKKFALSCMQVGATFETFGRAMVAPFVASARVFSEFDDKMRRVSAVTSSTSEQLRTMTEVARTLGASTAFTASQVAGGMASLGMMGFSPAEIEAATGQVMALSSATGTELAEAATIAANQLRVFGMGASHVSEVTDILAATANGSAQTLTDLGEAIKVAGPVAAQSGQSLRQTAAAIGVLANMGIRGSMAGTALSRSYRQMADPEIRKFLASLGVKTTDAAGNLRNMAVIFAELGASVSKMGSADQIATFEKVFGARGILAGQTLSVNPAGLQSFLSALENSTGYCKRAEEEMEGGIGGALRNIKSAAEAVAISLGKAFNAEWVVATFRGIALSLRGIAEALAFLAPIVPVVSILAGAFLALGVALKTCSAVTTFLRVLDSAPALFASIAAATTANTAATTAGAAAATAGASAHAANAAAINSETAALAKNTAAQGVNAAAQGVGAAATTAGTVSNVGKTVGGAAVGIISFVLVKCLAGLKIALAAIWKLVAAVASSPVTIIVAMIAAAYGAIYYFATKGAKDMAEETSKNVDATLSDSEEKIRKFKAKYEDGKTSRSSFAKSLKDENKELAKELYEVGQKRAKLAEGGLFKRGNLAAVEKLSEAEGKLVARIMANREELAKLSKETEDANATRRQSLMQAEKELGVGEKMKSQTEKELEENEKKLSQLNEMYEQEKRVARLRGDKRAYLDLERRQAMAISKSNELRNEILTRDDKAKGISDLYADANKREREREGKRSENRENSIWDAMRKTSPGMYAAQLQRAFFAVSMKIGQQVEAYMQTLYRYQSANSDGGDMISAKEQRDLKLLKDRYEELQKRKDLLGNRLEDIRNGAASAAKSSSPMLATRSLAAIFGTRSEDIPRNQLAVAKKSGETLGRIENVLTRMERSGSAAQSLAFV